MTQKGFRSDIQGLRAFAVVAVVLDHLIHWPSGGFVGVDIFFVISGFLITGLLLREQELKGKISFGNFYRRRIKRIIPASLLVLVSTLVASYLVFGWSRFVGVLWDGLAASLFAANWRFAVVGSDYFQVDGPISPLQHYWSLAVEEQFYFVWPWIIVLVFATVTRFGRLGAGRTGVGIAITVISVASFLWALFESQNNNTFAYFSTLSRSWELGVGAFIAVISPWLIRLPFVVRPIMAWVGMAGMVYSVFNVTESLSFPAPLALIPVASVALIIIAGTGVSGHSYIWPLSNRLSNYLGNISFSLYLWHFPVIIIGSQMLNLSDISELLVLAACFVALSIYSFHLVEDPVRKSAWLEDSRRSRRLKRGMVLDRRYQITALSALACITAAVVTPLVDNRDNLIEPSAASPLVASEKLDAIVDSQPPELARLQSEIGASLGATTWPALSPSMDEAVAGSGAPEDILGCGDLSRLVDEDACTWGPSDATKTAIVIGDSTSMGYVYGIRSIVDHDPSWMVKSFGTFGCTYTDVPEERVDPDCAARKSAAIDAIKRIRPDVVLISNHYVERSPAGVERTISASERTASVASFVEKFQDAAGEVVFIAPPPQGINIATCYTKVSTPSSCTASITPTWLEASANERMLADRIGGTYLDSREWFCALEQCPPFVGTTPVKRDLMHATPKYQERIAPVLLEALSTSGVI